MTLPTTDSLGRLIAHPADRESVVHRETPSVCVRSPPLTKPGAASSLTLPLPPAHGPVGLSAFFGGLAAGDDTVGLVQTLRRTFLRRAQSIAAEPHPAQPSHKAEHGDLSGAHDGGSGGGCAADPSPSPAAAAEPPTALRRATKVAMLLALEHPSAADEATYLYCTPSTHAHLPGRFPVRRGRLRWLLSDRAAAQLARHCLHETGDATAARELLSLVAPTPEVRALKIECCGRLGEWREALAALESVPPSMWTEMDVSLTVRALYHAARKADGRERAKGGPVRVTRPARVPQDDSPDRFHTLPLRLLRTARDHGVHSGSPTALNDALGLLSLGGEGLWPRAVELLECTLFAPQAASPAAAPSRTPYPAGGAVCGPLTAPPQSGAISGTAVADTSGDIAVFYPDGAGGLSLSQDPRLRNALDLLEEEEDHLGRHGRGGGGDGGANPPWVESQRPTPCAGPLASSLLRPNAITVYQACRALRGRPDLAFRYATAMTQQYDVRVVTDGGATEAYLRACAKSGEWAVALAVLRERGALCRTPPKGKGDRARAQLEPSRVGAACPAEPRTLSPDVLLSLLRLLGEHPRASQWYQELLTSLFDPHATRGADLAWELSRHYNRDTLSRAYNTMLQHASTLADAERIYATLARVIAPDGVGRMGPPAGEASGGAAGADRLAVDVTGCSDGSGDSHAARDDRRLENESYERFVILYAQSGDWTRALGCLHTLLYHPRRRQLYVPTTFIHDTVQYALEQSAPATTLSTGPQVHMSGAPWQASVALFREMCDREVPSSTVAFQSVVKRCFAQGVPDEAQKLFRLLMRHGVRR